MTLNYKPKYGKRLTQKLLRQNVRELNTSTHIYFNPSRTESLNDIKLLIETNDSFIFSDEENPIDTYRNICDYIYKLTEELILCGGNYSGEILHETSDSNAVIVLTSKENPNILPRGDIFGFAFIFFDEKDNSIEIKLICSHKKFKYAGETLLASIEDICKTLFMQKIKLQAVLPAIRFYEKYGYEIVKGDNYEMNKIYNPTTRYMVKYLYEEPTKSSSIGGNRQTKKKYRNNKFKNYTKTSLN